MSDHPKFPETRVALMESWAKVGSTVGLQDAGVLFFKRIFELAPEALSMFSFSNETDVYESPKLKAHALKVMNTVGVAVGMLNDVPKLLPILADLGKKHVSYGVLPAHYDVIGQALLDTLALGLGDTFTPALKAAWAEIYGIISTTMIGDNYPKAPEHPKFPETKAALQQSWAKVGSTVGLQDAGVLFFKRIFELAPEALSMFSFGDEANLYESPKLKAHALKVMNTVGVAVGMLDDVPKLLPILADLGQKHVGYGVVPAHYDVIGQALLDTLALGLGDAFTPALKAAWAEIYGIISTTMIGDALAYPAAAIKLGRYTKPVDEKQAAAVMESQKSAMSWWTTSGNNLGG